MGKGVCTYIGDAPFLFFKGLSNRLPYTRL